MSIYYPVMLAEIIKGGAEMSENVKYTCGFCKSKTCGDDGFIYCPYCGEPYDTKGYVTDRPWPCVRDEHGEIKEQTVKRLFQKINEELDELKFEITTCLTSLDTNITKEPNDEWAYDTFTRNRARGDIVAEEAADTITAITTMLESLGIDVEMRDEAQRRVNAKNRERGRL